MKISSYTTTYNCLDMDYPILQCLESLWGFSDEVCIADAGSTDDTIEQIKVVFPKTRIKIFPVDFHNPRWAIQIDGWLKSKARDMCTGDALWQTDNDEIIHSDQYEAVKNLCNVSVTRNMLISTPVMEFWGSVAVVRDDIGPKPRVSSRAMNLRHDIPNGVRLSDDDDHPYPAPFYSDTCDYVNADGDPVPSYFSPTPNIWHVSWLDFRRKIEHYRDFWHKFHKSMYNLDDSDSSDNNVMFDKPWHEVTDEDIHGMVEKMYQMGPRSFHKKTHLWYGKTRRLSKDEIIPDCIMAWSSKASILKE